MMESVRSRFAVYLIPPYRIARDVAEIHRMLHKQFGFVAAGRFQVHATLKGFFKKTPGPITPLVTQLDTFFAAQAPFPVEIHGLRCDEIGVGLNVSQLGDAPNLELLACRERVVKAVRPFIASDCDFVAADLGQPFEAHLTLAFRDIPPVMQAEVLAYLRDAPIPLTGTFTADTFHLLEFFSERWTGHWEQDLTWRLLKSWSLC
ncbi:MAG: 2'-5' RNA ligase family protein [Anaerolineae bacterium]|nr:2'-5' RNA ligase family protein [Anaerolineae bacterium]